MGRVIVVGSVNVDWTVVVPRLPGVGETALGGDPIRRHGGKGANQAVAAALAGASVAFVGAVGADDAGTEEIRALHQVGIDTSQLRRIDDAATGVALIAVDREGDNQIVVGAGANGRLDGPRVGSALSRLGVRELDVVLVGNEVPDAAVNAAVTGSGRAILNPAPARALTPATIAAGPILTPNQHEAAQLTGRDDHASAAAALRALTGATVIVTLGGQGALLDDGQAAQLLAAPACEPVDTTGAGDVFNGVLAAQLAAGGSVREAAEAALVQATASTQWAGARDPRAAAA